MKEVEDAIRLRVSGPGGGRHVGARDRRGDRDRQIGGAPDETADRAAGDRGGTGRGRITAEMLLSRVPASRSGGQRDSAENPEPGILAGPRTLVGVSGRHDRYQAKRSTTLRIWGQ